MSLVIVLLTTTLGAIVVWLPFCRRRRRERLAPIVHSIKRAERHLEPVQQLPAQLSLVDRLNEWSQAKDIGEGSIRKATDTKFPITAAPGPRDGLEEIFQRLAATLGNPKLAVAVAGGEQIVQNLFEIVSPEATGHFADAAATVFKDGLLQMAMESARSGFGPALMQYATFHGINHILEHHGVTIEALTQIPGHAVDTLHTAGLEVLKGTQDITNHLQHAAAGHSILDLSHAHGGHAAGAVGAHVPWATILMSSLREATLLIDEKTTAARALAHIAVDTVATGGGALAGMKGGALAGAPFGPFGAVIGSIVGAVVGGMGGRYLAERGKRLRLEFLSQKLAEKAREAEQALTLSGRSFAQSVHNTCVEASSAYQEAIYTSPDFDLMVQQDVLQSEASLQLIEGLQHEIDLASREVAAELESIRIPRATVWERLLGLDISSLAQSLLKQAHERRLDWAAQLRASLPAKGESPIHTYHVLATISCPRSSSSHFLRAADRATAFPEMFMRAVGAWLAEAAAAFQAGALALDRVVSVETERHQGEVVKWRKSLGEAEEEVRRECGALGIS